MKRSLFVFYMIVILICLEGCADPQKEDVMKEDVVREKDDQEILYTVFEETRTYFMEVTDHVLFVPRLKLDEVRHTFVLEYDPRSSNMLLGSYEIRDEILVAKTEDGKNVYQFVVLDGEALEFDWEESSEISLYKEGVGIPIEENVIFKSEKVENRGTRIDIVGEGGTALFGGDKEAVVD